MFKFGWVVGAGGFDSMYKVTGEEFDKWLSAYHRVYI